MLKKNINRKSFSNKIYQNIGFSKTISENIVNDIFYIIISAFKENEKIKIKSFGTFRKKTKKKKNGPQPQNQGRKSHISKKCSYI